MKKLFCLSLAAVALAALPQPASAWHNFKFGAGVNLEWSCGGNQFGICGHPIYRSGDVPGGFGHGGFGGHGFGGGYMGGPVIVVDPHQGHGGKEGGKEEETRASVPMGNGHAQTVPYNPYHYSSYQSGYYYQDPSYYYGQNTWYGW